MTKLVLILSKKLGGRLATFVSYSTSTVLGCDPILNICDSESSEHQQQQ